MTYFLLKLFGFIKRIMDLLPNSSLYFVYIKNTFDVPLVFKFYPKMKFMASSVKTFFRYKKILTKEPDMIDWINSFHPGSVFWDVGANVGIFSFYANYSPNVEQVYSFEPDPLNYYEFTRNMILNRTQKIKSFNCGLGPRHTSLFNINYDSLSVNSGGSYRSLDFDEEIKSLDGLNVISFSFSGLIELYNIRIPNYVKIDIDGMEEYILDGQEDFFKIQDIKEVLIEVDDSQIKTKEFIYEFFSRCGYSRKESNRLTPTGTTYNVIFRRA